MESRLEEVQSLLEGPGPLGTARILAVEPLAGDASNRAFTRLRVAGAGVPKSLILLEYGASSGPRFVSKEPVPQEEALRQLAPFFADRGVPVPTLYRYVKESRAFLFEDLGDRSLAQFLMGGLDDEGEKVKDLLGPEWKYELMRRAIDILADIRRIPFTPSCIAFTRTLGFENYRGEVQEFFDYYLSRRNISRSAAEVVGNIFDALCESVLAVPRTLSHFDYHCYNLMVEDSGKLRLVDFQDACEVSSARDLVSLLNDRDMDMKLGQELQSRLLTYATQALALPAQFPEHYDFTLLHWDLRVAGRFIKLCEAKATDRYREWLPGTLRRLGRTLRRAQRRLHRLDDFLEITLAVSPEMQEGFDDPWEFPVAS